MTPIDRASSFGRLILLKAANESARHSCHRDWEPDPDGSNRTMGAMIAAIGAAFSNRIAVKALTRNDGGLFAEPFSDNDRHIPLSGIRDRTHAPMGDLVCQHLHHAS